LLNINDSSARSANTSGTIIYGASSLLKSQFFQFRKQIETYESNSAEVGKLDERVTLFEILNDPFGVVLAEGAICLAAKGMGYGLARCD
jgi:hypothetical protein